MLTLGMKIEVKLLNRCNSYINNLRGTQKFSTKVENYIIIIKGRKLYAEWSKGHPPLPKVCHSGHVTGERGQHTTPALHSSMVLLLLSLTGQVSWLDQKYMNFYSKNLSRIFKTELQALFDFAIVDFPFIS